MKKMQHNWHHITPSFTRPSKLEKESGVGWGGGGGGGTETERLADRERQKTDRLNITHSW